MSKSLRFGRTEASGGDVEHSQKITTPDAIVFDPSMGTGPIAKSCLMEQQHRKVTPSDSEGALAEIITLSLLETVPEQILKTHSHLVQNACVENATNLHFRYCASAQSGLTRLASQTFNGLPAVQNFFLHVSQSIYKYFCDIDLYEKVRHIPCR